MGEHTNISLKDLHTESDEILYIYTDGSRLIENKVCLRVSSAALLVYNNHIIDYMYDESENEKDCQNWNVGGEMNAAYMGLKLASLKYSSHKNICFVCDYEGVKKWTTGEWRIKDNVPDSVSQLKELYNFLLEIGFVIRFLHVYSHTSETNLASYYNDQTDKLATNRDYVPRDKVEDELIFEITENRMVKFIAFEGTMKYGLYKETTLERFLEEYVRNELMRTATITAYKGVPDAKDIMLSKITLKTRKGIYRAKAY